MDPTNSPKRTSTWEKKMAAGPSRMSPLTASEPHRASSTISNVSARSSFARRPSRDPPQKVSLPNPPPVPSRSELPPRPCEACKSTSVKTFFCANCDGNFCEECWGKERPHFPGKVGPDGMPHEKADPEVVNRLKETFTPSRDPAVQKKLHIEDEDTTWFGIERDESDNPFFQDYGRFADLMLNSASGETVRYPQLVSFIGQTGAGKSTLIKMLIEQQRIHDDPTTVQLFPAPIPGSVRDDNIATSGDVHLYADPATYMGPLPMLYADCEGLEGGENIPVANRHRESAFQAHGRKRNDSPNHDGRGVKRRFKAMRASRRDIAWATSPETQKRQYAVTELYPRLLYTFSDVIVFVLQNPKTFESTVIKMLLKWASSSMEKSLNQPTLPHAVIALNHTDMGVDSQEWNSDFATQKLLETVSGAMQRDAKYREYADFWTSKGKTVRTMKDLLECYYSSVRVVRIPKKGRYMLIDDQVRKLHQEITQSCTLSYYTKRKARMLSSADELQMYLQSAFDHFAQNLETPFNFIDVAFRNNPIPLDFGGNILKLAMAVKNAGHCQGGREIFRQLSSMVASCIALDCVRHGHLGSIDELLKRFYLDYCDWALQDFCGRCEPCQFTNRKGECVNVQEGHSKGHQNARGTIIDGGQYQSSFNWNTFEEEWLYLLQSKAKALQISISNQLIKDAGFNEIKVTSDLHREKMQDFYRRVGGANRIFSHSICLCCVRDMAEHPLPCGHVLCWSCIAEYGEFQQGYQITMRSCPLHADAKFENGWIVKYKPPMAGVRILTLDGGGIRGIVELEVLHEIEKYLGGKINIQKFFDLIVGTSTGGILALGLGVECWSVQECILKFKSLANQAFTPRFLSGFETMGSMGIRYKTKPLEAALKEVFQDANLFGGKHVDSSSYHTKVAVTAATKTADQAVIFGNYNRDTDPQATYGFVRPDDPLHELLIWEAARATSAAPTFFRSFVNPRTRQEYLDGALYYNCPAKVAFHESKLIWRDMEDAHPDILLSIGTGHNGRDTSGVLELRHRSIAPRDRHLENNVPLEEQRRTGFGAWLKSASVAKFWYTLVHRVDNVLNAEMMWRDFRSWVDDERGREGNRFVRINPHLGCKPPRMDEKKEMEGLSRRVQEQLKRRTDYPAKIRRVAHRLVASTFFFEKKELLQQPDGAYLCRGRIRCRFASGTSELRELGKFLSRSQSDQFQPFFRIYERQQEHVTLDKVITSSQISEMINFSKFSMGASLEIPCSEKLKAVIIALGLRDETGLDELVPISGFPRCLAIDNAPRESPNLDRQHLSLRRRSARRRRSEPTDSTPTLSSFDKETGLSRHITDDQIDSLSHLPEFAGCRIEDPNDWIFRKTAGSRYNSPLSLPPYEPQASSSSDSSVRTSHLSRAGEEVFELPAMPVQGQQQPDEDDEDLAKAIALSLADQAERERAGNNPLLGRFDYQMNI